MHFPLPLACLNFATLSLYFLYPYVACANDAPLSSVVAVASPSLFLLGGFFHYGADSQKFFMMRHGYTGLITDGFFGIVRHPSYFGEILMWLALTFLSGSNHFLSWVPLFYLLFVTIGIGVPTKETSLSRHKEFDEWCAQTSCLIPFIW